MKKAICLFGQNPEVDAICEAIIEREKRASERVAFLRKQAHDEGQASVDDNKPRWDQLIATLKERGLLKTYDPEKDMIAFDANEGTVFCTYGTGDAKGGYPVERFFRGLFT